MSFRKFSELECYDVCVSLGEFVREKSNETQTVGYEDFRLASRQPFVGPVFDDDGEEIVHSNPTTEITNVSGPDDEMDMNRIEKYSGGGGAPIASYCRDTRSTYLSMRDDPMRQRIEGFGEWEFMMLLGTTLTGEAREVHNAYMDDHSFTNRSNPHYRRARRAERIRVLWRVYRRDRSAFLSLRAQSGIAVEPTRPEEPEPEDIEDFLFDLQERFRSSTTQILASIHTFRPEANEGLERMFARFNLIARPLENERPPSLTGEQITTHYVHHLETILSTDDFRELQRQIHDVERNRRTDGRRPINRHHIHDLALQQDREIVLRQTRLRSAGIVSAPKPSIQDRLSNKMANRLGEQGKEKGETINPNRGRTDERERRTCNNCLVRGHLMKDCVNPTADKVKEDMLNKKRPSLENDVKPERPVYARTATTDGGRGRGYGRGGGRTGGQGGRTGGRGVNPNNPHMTANVTCAFCHVPNHTEQQCWRKNPHLRPGANLAAVRQIGLANDREWEAEHLAREQRQKAMEDARDQREAEKDSQRDLDRSDRERNHQYMLVAVEDFGTRPNTPERDQCMEHEVSGFEDDLSTIFQIGADNEVLEDLQTMFDMVDEMTAEQTNEYPPLPPPVYDPHAVPVFMTEAMAVLPKAKLPVRRSTREGAGKRRVQFAGKEPDRWQQIPRHVLAEVHQAGPSTAVVQPATLKSTVTVRRPTLKSTVRRATPTPEEVEEEREELLDLSRVPRSFPTNGQEVPTPGTTTLHEPPEGTPEAPSTAQTTPIAELDNDIEMLETEPPNFSSLQKIGRLERMLAEMNKQLTELKGDVFLNQRAAEQAKMAPMPVVTVMSENVARATFKKYNEAQQRCGDTWAMATLNTNQGQIDIQGFVPKIAVVDTGAARIILGKKFAENIKLCGQGMLRPAGSFLTASGEEVTGLMKTAHCLEITLAKGTKQVLSR